ncbi:hypothetical protein FACS1894206_02780 [Deltaproteobacteria bacterium]|nr:hypothetical protein FACS1894206_02780 [Deltaproteobacteria bacterium]
MRILYIGGRMLLRGFTELGHTVFTLGLDAEADIRTAQPINAVSLFRTVCGRGFLPDCVFWCDDGNLPCIIGMEEMPCATAFYSIDTYCNLWHFGFANAFDAVFVAQKDHVPLFPVTEVATRYLPLFAPVEALTPLDGPASVRDIPVAFVGTRKHPNNPDREPFLRHFKRAQPLFLHTGPYADVFRRSRIILNQTAAGEVNFRCFEAMASGAALLMEKCGHGLEEIFTPGEHILPLYRRNNWREAADIARRALACPEKTAEIAARGQEHVLHKHTARHRAQVAQDVMAGLIQENAMQNRLARLDYRRAFLAAAYVMLGRDLVGRLDGAYSAFYLDLAEKTRMRIVN